jgi:hypothetical protein
VQQLWEEAPNDIDGAIKSNFSTLKPNLIIYRDANGNAKQVFNLLNRDTSTLLEAGINEFTMRNPFNPSVDGKKGELYAFSPKYSESSDLEAVNMANKIMVDEIIDFIMEQDIKWGDYMGSTSNTPIEYLKTFPGWVANITSGGAIVLVEVPKTRYDAKDYLYLDSATLFL